MTFIIIVIFSFYILVHNVFDEGDKAKMLKILKKLFNHQEITQALKEIDGKDI